MINYPVAIKESGATMPMDEHHLRKVIAFLEAMANRLKEPPNALYVDDSTNDIELVKPVFSKFIVKVTFCSDTVEAMKLIQEHGFDVIFTDIFAPKLAGDEMMEKVLGFKPDQRFVAVTGHPSSDVISRAIKRGALMAFEKPLNEANLELFFHKRQTPIA